MICLDPDLAYLNVAMVLDGTAGISGLTLDCQGASVSGTGVCVNVDTAPGTRVESCQFDGCAVGVRVASSPGAVVEQNEFLGAGLAVQVEASLETVLVSNSACEAGLNAFQNDGSGSLEGNVCTGGHCSFQCTAGARAVPSVSTTMLWIMAMAMILLGVARIADAPGRVGQRQQGARPTG